MLPSKVMSPLVSWPTSLAFAVRPQGGQPSLPSAVPAYVRYCYLGKPVCSMVPRSSRSDTCLRRGSGGALCPIARKGGKEQGVARTTMFGPFCLPPPAGPVPSRGGVLAPPKVPTRDRKK